MKKNGAFLNVFWCLIQRITKFNKGRIPLYWGILAQRSAGSEKKVARSSVVLRGL